MKFSRWIVIIGKMKPIFFINIPIILLSSGNSQNNPDSIEEITQELIPQLETLLQVIITIRIISEYASYHCISPICVDYSLIGVIVTSTRYSRSSRIGARQSTTATTATKPTRSNAILRDSGIYWSIYIILRSSISLYFIDNTLVAFFFRFNLL